MSPRIDVVFSQNAYDIMIRLNENLSNEIKVLEGEGSQVEEFAFVMLGTRHLSRSVHRYLVRDIVSVDNAHDNPRDHFAVRNDDANEALKQHRVSHGNGQIVGVLHTHYETIESGPSRDDLVHQPEHMLGIMLDLDVDIFYIYTQLSPYDYEVSEYPRHHASISRFASYRGDRSYLLRSPDRPTYLDATGTRAPDPMFEPGMTYTLAERESVK